MGGGTTTVERDCRSSVTLYPEKPWGATGSPEGPERKGVSRAKVVLMCVASAVVGFVVGWLV